MMVVRSCRNYFGKADKVAKRMLALSFNCNGSICAFTCELIRTEAISQNLETRCIFFYFKSFTHLNPA